MTFQPIYFHTLTITSSLIIGQIQNIKITDGQKWPNCYDNNLIDKHLYTFYSSSKPFFHRHICEIKVTRVENMR